MAARSNSIMQTLSLENSATQCMRRETMVNGKYGQFTQLLMRATHETTIHGIRQIVGIETETLRRFLWILVVIACSAFFGQQLYVRVSDFISNPKSVNVEVVYAQSLTFPQVILCNKNAFKVTTLFPMLFRSVRTFFSIEPDQITPELVAQIAEYDRRRTMYMGVATNMTNTFIENRHLLEDMLIDCKYKGKACTASNFTIVLSESGVCYRFVSHDDTIETTSAGSSNGLTLMMNIEQYAYTYGQKASAGLDVFFKDTEEPAVIYGDSVSVQPGGETSIGLDLSVMEELRRPNGACDDLSLKYYNQYSRAACRQECLTDFIVQKCSCKSPGMPGNIPYCSLVTLYNCSYPLQAKFSLLPESVACDCPPRCHESRYSPTVNYAPISKFMLSAIVQDIRLSRGTRILKDILKARDILTYHSNSSAESNANDIQVIMRVGTPLAKYVDAVQPLYEIIAEMKSMLRQLNESSSSYTSRSLSLPPLLSQFNNDLDALLSNLTFIDPSITCTPAFIDNAGTTASNLQFCLDLFLLGSFGRTESFETMGIHGIYAPEATNLLQNVFPACQASASKMDQMITLSTGDAAKNVNMSRIHIMMDNFTETSRNVQDALRDVLVGMQNLSRYAEEAHRHIGVEEVIDAAFVRENLLKVNVFFKDISYTQITKQLSDSVVSLICDVGGTFGLCLGASIMSIYELLDFIISLVLLYQRKNTRAT